MMNEYAEIRDRVGDLVIRNAQLRNERDEAVRELGDLVELARAAMADANLDCGEYEIDEELAAPRAFIARIEGEQK